jgi:hypothetical protein
MCILITQCRLFVCLLKFLLQTAINYIKKITRLTFVVETVLTVRYKLDFCMFFRLF